MTPDEIAAEHARLRAARETAMAHYLAHRDNPQTEHCCAGCLYDSVTVAEQEIAWFESRNGLAR